MFRIYNQRLAGFLMLKGFRLFDIEPNRNDTNLNIFIFNDSEHLRQTMKQYAQIKNFII